LQWSENLVDEIDLSCGLDAFEFEIDCVANDGFNLSIDAASFEETLLGGIQHLKNEGDNLSIGAASLDALLNCTEHFNELQVIYIYLHASKTYTKLQKRTVRLRNQRTSTKHLSVGSTSVTI